MKQRPEEKRRRSETGTEIETGIESGMGEAGHAEKRVSPAAAAWQKAVAEAKYTEETGGAPIPLVSICCITFNHAAYLRDAIEGFLSQKTDFPYEILIYDDASTDGTQEIIRDYAARYPSLIFPLLQNENQYQRGVSNTSVFNFPRVRGTYIAMCEGDDFWTDPEKLSKQITYLQSHPDCALCLHSARMVSVDGSITAGMMRPYRKDRKIQPGEIVNKTAGYPTASLVFPAEIVKKLPDFYLDCPVGDIPMQLMMAMRGYAYYMDSPMSVYRVGVASSWTSLMKQGDYERKQKEYSEAMTRMYRAFDQESGGRFHAEAEEAAERIFFLTKVNTKDYQTVRQKKYRHFYRELDLRTRFFIRFEMLLPGLYRSLQSAVQRRREGK